jgi:imidazolonepropionase-like amidohydrolase
MKKFERPWWFQRFYLASGFLFFCCCALAQVTFPVNGIADHRDKLFAFTHATIVADSKTTLVDATLLIGKGKVLAMGTSLSLPPDAVTVDCSGKYLYPSFIDIYSDYGIAVLQRQPGGFSFGRPVQMESDKKGAYYWNQAIKPETEAYKLFMADPAKATSIREQGFGIVLSHQKDGIARGTGVLVTLGEDKENLLILKPQASAHYSFSKGVSTQGYPSSMMGSIALLRQTYLDAAWYKTKPDREGVNISLQAWLDEQDLPQIFEAGDKWNDLRANRIAEEFGVHYILKAGGNEYQRIQEIAATKAAYILPLNFPPTLDVEDPNDAKYVSLADMKHWELAPTNPAAFEKAGIMFCLTAADLKDPKQFLANLRKAIDNGLGEPAAFDALTKTPASLLGVYDQVGSLAVGKLANFLITSGPLFDQKTSILENWIQGQRYGVKDADWTDIRGSYRVVINDGGVSSSYTLHVQGKDAATLISGKDSLNTKFSYDGKLIRLSFARASNTKKPPAGKDSVAMATPQGRPSASGGEVLFRLSGVSSGHEWNGNGVDSAGNAVIWTAVFDKAVPASADSAHKKPRGHPGKILYPFCGYGWEQLPSQQDLLIKNATVWTNEPEGRLENTDVLVKSGKIAALGKNISAPGAIVIDGTGKQLTPGIIDEHSHIATSSINEGAHAVTSEVRIADNLNPEDINIYRQLAGGVTSSHILHGSANPIGGQTQLIKLRWGMDDEQLKFTNWDPFIKFALGENVKRTTAIANNRFPDTRMGVQEVYVDAFQRATDYENQWKAAESNNKNKNLKPITVRRDLQLDALVEILNKKRFITCHSYITSEILGLMQVGDQFGFRVNTFTHVLEGYKVAAELKAHGANVSTFSDWWGYKTEVQDAIAYNATIMQRVGLNVCINSDDPEQARHLNQEAAKSMKYGGMSEENALKMVTLNPAIALHVADRVGSIKVGKDADLVLWTDNPLSIYAKPVKTIVDGIVYFDLVRDSTMRDYIRTERNRLIQKMLMEKKSGAPVSPAAASGEEKYLDEDNQDPNDGQSLGQDGKAGN